MYKKPHVVHNVPAVHVSPINTMLKPIGRTSSNWNQAGTMIGALRQFGVPPGVRSGHTQLPIIPSGADPGITYHAGMKAAYDYLKNPRGADGTVMMDNSVGNLNAIEKNLRSQQQARQLQQQIVQFSAQQQQLASMVEQIQNVEMGDFSSITDQISVINTNIGTLQTFKTNNETKITDAYNFRTQYMPKVDTLETFKSNNESKITDAYNFSTQYKSKVDNLETFKTDNETKITQADEFRTQYKSKVDDLETFKTNNETKITQADTFRNQYKPKVDSLETWKETKDQLDDWHDGKITEIEAAIAALPSGDGTTDLTPLTNQVNALQGAVSQTIANQTTFASTYATTAAMNLALTNYATTSSLNAYVTLQNFGTTKDRTDQMFDQLYLINPAYRNENDPYQDRTTMMERLARLYRDVYFTQPEYQRQYGIQRELSDLRVDSTGIPARVTALDDEYNPQSLWRRFDALNTSVTTTQGNGQTGFLNRITELESYNAGQRLLTLERARVYAFSINIGSAEATTGITWVADTGMVQSVTATILQTTSGKQSMMYTVGMDLTNVIGFTDAEWIRWSVQTSLRSTRPNNSTAANYFYDNDLQVILHSEVSQGSIKIYTEENFDAGGVRSLAIDVILKAIRLN